MLRTLIASALMAASEALAHAALRIQPKPITPATIESLWGDDDCRGILRRRYRRLRRSSAP